uniref:Reverse transcriptase Ty1/copia-type domain-containing protein n=1 Tax=Tanacetum cinerariifolium TaxID=118510 RepID=A0A699JGM6_TANCI|nr:hypothetical protein [Tanacetum cinerariifolium]
MIGNVSYLTDYEEIDEGYVAFGGNPKGGKITGKGTIRTGNLDFENVYFVRELKFNLFSINRVNVIDETISIELLFDPNMPALEDVCTFDFSSDDEDDGFEDLDFPDRVYMVEKAMYGLHHAPRAWHKGNILLVQVYVDDIIFGSTKKELCFAFERLMHKKFQMSSIGELTFFLGLQMKQKMNGIFISQDKYVAKILRKYRFTEVKTANTHMETQKPLLKDEDSEEVDVYMYRSMDKLRKVLD